LNFVESRKEATAINLANYHNTLARQYKARSKSREFKIGELVMRKVLGTAVKPNHEKLRQNYEGLHIATSASETGFYHLQDMYGRPIPNPWNVANLRNYYH